MINGVQEPGLPYSFGAYQIKIRITERPLLLVEGKDDKQFFDKLLNEASKQGYALAKDITIDIADMIQDDKVKGMGKREIVETVCEAVPQEILRSKNFCGFVDREFRGFQLDGSIEDTISDHWVSGSLVWSRGHSFENYCFDFNILNEHFEVCSSLITSALVASALNLFKEILQSVLHVACAISLAARDSQYLSVTKGGSIKGCIHWTNLCLRDGKLDIDIHKFKEILLKTDSRSEKIENFVEKYKYWHQRLALVDQKIFRWMCHGHIGFAAIWAAYTFCVYKAVDKSTPESKKKKIVHDVFNKNEDERLYMCSLTFTKQAMHRNITYPQNCS